MKTILTLLIGIAIGAVAVFFGYPAYEMRDATMDPECKAVVKLSLAGNEIQAEPENACLHKGRKLTWEVTAGPQDKVEIDFKGSDPDGPFPPEKSADPARKSKPGHYELTGPGEIETKAAGKKGRFRYNIKWTPYGGTTIEKDPAVCIRGG